MITRKKSTCSSLPQFFTFDSKSVMMKTIVCIGLLALVVGLSSFQQENTKRISKYDANSTLLFSTGINSGATGAPGESTCFDCHQGGLQDGSAQHIFTVSQNGNAVSSYIPGQTYDVKLELTTGNVLEGFQATVLDLANDDMAGNFTSTNNGTNVIQPGSGSRQYVNQTANSNMEGNPGWEWEWEAPSNDLGPVRFYVASNVADGDLNPDDDFIYTSEYTFGSPLGTEETTENISGFEVGYTMENNSLQIRIDTELSEMMFLNVIDLSGRSVLTKMIGQSSIGSNEEQVFLPAHLESGIYVVHFFVGNNSISSTVRVLSNQ